ncbi:hypothetical protein [Actinocrispum sp. NPDC049592]|uniref:PP2C family protein-serine/threonine phosphatase n=1 Tax=Actinocrispum sp. NPDC049592 TaxID=3154835 RepID=UPI0034212ACD
MTAQIRSYRPHEPGHLLLCTDGLWRYLPTASSLRAMLTGDPAKDATELVQHALDKGGHDNITVVVISVTAR